ncbi:MAG: leucyl/phenylalanyl-tRNA--protein transferase [Caulobacterales bacterium]
MSRRFGPDELLACYKRGVFPMADSRDDPRLFIVDPDLRGVLPFETFHVSRRLAKTIRGEPFTLRVDTAFRRVMEECAAQGEGRRETWINDSITDLYCSLFVRGVAHSVECWVDDRLVGGLYGVSLGGAFFGESMFSRERDASKVALVHLVARLIEGGYRLLDTQFVTDHLRQFGAIEIQRSDFQRRLGAALAVDGDFFKLSADATGVQALQSIAQTS